MAVISERTKITLVLVLVNIINLNNGDSDVIKPNNYTMDDIQTADQHSRGSEERQDLEDLPGKYQNIEPEELELNLTSSDNNKTNEQMKLNDDTEPNSIERLSTKADYMTTTYIPEDVPEALGLKNPEDSKEVDDRRDDMDSFTSITPLDTTESTIVDYTLSIVDNNVYKSKDGVLEDIYSNSSNNIENVSKTETTTTPETTRMNNEAVAPRIAGLDDETETSGQRNPKTENTNKQPVDKPKFDAKPRPAPPVKKSTTLKGWLEDSWLRPPAGILVPLRPMALTRALAVWNDLTAVEGLNVSDIVVVGYDTNGVNWRSRHNLQPSSTRHHDRTVSEALSKLLLKYQGVNTDATSDGTMRALASAAKLVPYDSALFVVTDKGAGDPQRLPLALRALVEKRLKVYTIWTDPNHPSSESEIALQELRNVSSHTEGEVLPYSLQVMEMEGSNMASEAELEEWQPLNTIKSRQGRLNTEVDNEDYDILLVRRGGGEAISLGVPVENGVTSLRVYIEGAVEHAVLYPPNEAPQIDLYNLTSVRAFSPMSRTDGLSPRDVHLIFPGVEMDEETMLSVVPMSSPSTFAPAAMVGTWHLSLRCDTCDYRFCVNARSLIHFDAEIKSKDMLKLRVSGPVASIRESVLVDEYGSELAKLPFNYQPMTEANHNDDGDGPLAELVADVALPSVKGSKIYAKILGRDIRGEPFGRLSGPLNQEVRMGRSAALVFPDPVNDLERSEETNSRVYNSKLQYNETNLIPNNRAGSQVANQQGSLLTAVQIGLSTRLYGAPGDNLQLHFEVTNFREQAVRFTFEAIGELRFLTGINPRSQTIGSGQTVNVIVSVGISSSAQPGARDFITFTAYGLEQVSMSAYVYVTNNQNNILDTWAPELSHNFQGTCIGRMGDDCAQYTWSATITARDALSGLLRLSSSPIGLTYDSNFVAGSRDRVIAMYRATCCAPRVMVTAVDSFGNANSYAVDISGYITGAGIAAIVLGIFLIIALIVLVVLLIYWCVKRRRESRELPSYSTSRNIS